MTKARSRQAQGRGVSGPLSPCRPENCTCLNLRQAARAVSQAYDEALQPTGLKATQFSLLMVAGAAGPVPLGRLATELVLDRTTLTRNLRPLVRDGLARIRQGDDGRTRIVEVTPAGRRRLDRAWPNWRVAQDRMVRRLGEPAWRDLLGGLRAAVGAA